MSGNVYLARFSNPTDFTHDEHAVVIPRMIIRTNHNSPGTSPKPNIPRCLELELTRRSKSRGLSRSFQPRIFLALFFRKEF